MEELGYDNYVSDVENLLLNGCPRCHCDLKVNHFRKDVSAVIGCPSCFATIYTGKAVDLFIGRLIESDGQIINGYADLESSELKEEVLYLTR